MLPAVTHTLQNQYAIWPNGPFILAYIFQNTTNWKTYFTCYYLVFVRKKYVHKIGYTYFISIIHDEHIWGTYVHIYDNYDVSGIKQVTRSAVHRQCHR